jgi:hypothetical protein
MDQCAGATRNPGILSELDKLSAVSTKISSTLEELEKRAGPVVRDVIKSSGDAERLPGPAVQSTVATTLSNINSNLHSSAARIMELTDRLDL